MKILFGEPPKRAVLPEDTDAGRPIRQPGRWAGVLLASMAGAVVFFVSLALLIAVGELLPAGASHPRGPIPWAGMLVAFFLCVLAHEGLHILLHPDSGRTDATILFIEWRKLQFGAYYEGRFPRARWIAMRLLPMAVVTVLPLTALLLLRAWMTFSLESYLWVLLLPNSLASGADPAAVLIVLRQAPPGGDLNFHRGRAYWFAEGTSGKKETVSPTIT
jgi:hypothetical protein